MFKKAFLKLKSKKEAAKVKPEFVHEIKDETTWDDMHHQPETSSFANTQTVKVVIDIRPPASRMLHNQLPSNPKSVNPMGTVYFLNSTIYPWHFAFVKSHLLSAQELRQRHLHANFNDKQYGSEDRDFVLGSLMRYGDQNNLLCFELWPGDNLAEKRVVEYIQMIDNLVKISTVVYRPTSDDQEKRIIPLCKSLKIKFITAKELFGNIRYQALTIGRTVGRLRFISSEQLKEENVQIRPFEILVLEHNANELPLCNGLITSCTQAPLCHTALLCQNRGSPNMSLIGVCQQSFSNEFSQKDIDRINQVKALDNKWIELTVHPHNFTAREIDKKLAVEELKARAKNDAGDVALAVNRDLTDLVDIPSTDSIKNLDISIGSKAFQLLKLSNLTKELKKDFIEEIVGFVLPFFHYFSFFEELKLNDNLSEILSIIEKDSHNLSESCDDFYSSQEMDFDFENFSILKNRKVLSSSLSFDEENKKTTTKLKTHQKFIEKLKMIENSILNCKNDVFSLENSAKLILEKIQKWNKSVIDNGVIIRSSTNVEDLDGFNGAGLYESVHVKTVDLNSIKNAIKTCYSSLWKSRSFLERESFHIKQEQVAMALLVQPYAKRIKNNGVAVSVIPFRPDFPGTFINVQLNDHKVTDDCGQAEQLAVYDENNGIVEVLSRSSLNNGNPILTEKQSQNLHFLVQKISEKIELKEKSNSIDVEFVFCGENEKLLLLQCRPCMYRM